MTRLSSFLHRWTQWALLLELGWCGFGASGGLMPELRLGLLRVVATRGSFLGIFAEQLSRNADAMTAARDHIQREG